ILRAAQLAPGQHVLDVAAGTGLVTKAIAGAVGKTGTVAAIDISRSMLAVAERRIGAFQNISLEVAEAKALYFPYGEFDAVICSLALMLLSDPHRGTSEFNRVLRRGGRVAVSVETTAERSLTTRINTAIGRHVTARAAAAAAYYSLGEPILTKTAIE